MSREELDNLVRIGRLKAEPGSRHEFAGMVKSARTRLADAQNESLDPDSQFDLAYGAAHRLALAALPPPRIPVGKPDHCFSDRRSHGGFGSCRRADFS
jgi:hypothetical protein